MVWSPRPARAACGLEGVAARIVLGVRPGLSSQLQPPGRAAGARQRRSNTATDHITVLDQALDQIPEQYRYGSPILIRSDSAGSSRVPRAYPRTSSQRFTDSVNYPNPLPDNRSRPPLPELGQVSAYQDGRGCG